MRTSYILAVASIVYTLPHDGGCPDQVRHHILEYVAARAAEAALVHKPRRSSPPRRAAVVQPIASGATGAVDENTP